MAPQCFLHLTGVCLRLGWQLPLAHGRAGDARGYGAAPSPVLCPGFCSELCDGNAASHRGRWDGALLTSSWNIWADLWSVSCIPACPHAASPGMGGVVLWGTQRSCPVWGGGCRLLLLRCSHPRAWLCSRWKRPVPAGTWLMALSVGTKRGAASVPAGNEVWDVRGAPRTRASASARPGSAVPFLIVSAGDVWSHGSSTLPVPLQHREWAPLHSAWSSHGDGTHIHCNHLVALAGDVQDGEAQVSPLWAWEQDMGGNRTQVWPLSASGSCCAPWGAGVGVKQAWENPVHGSQLPPWRTCTSQHYGTAEPESWGVQGCPAQPPLSSGCCSASIQCAWQRAVQLRQHGDIRHEGGRFCGAIPAH